MAVLTTFTVGGTSVVNLAQVASLRIEKRLNARSVASFTIRDADGDSASYRPAIRDEVLIVVDGVTEFLGLVWAIDETHIINTRGVQLTVRCVDYAALLDVVYFNGPIPAGLLRDVSTPLVNNLAPHGIYQDTGTDAGPAVGAQAFPFLTITNALNDLSLESSWVWRVSPQLGTNIPVIGFFEPGTVPAPQDFTTAVGRVERATFARDLTRYTNEVWVRYGEGTAVVTQRLMGDGTIREWRLENDLTLPYPGTVHVVRAGGASDETFSLWPSGGGTWQYDRANVWNQRIIHASGTVLGSGEYADLTFTAQFPGAVLARDDAEYGLHGPFTRVEDLPNVFDRATALAYAHAVLRRRGGNVRTGRIQTAVAGYAPLQTVTINLPNLSVNSAGFLITEVVMAHRTVGPGSVHHFGYTVTAIEGNEFQENWLDYYLPERRDRGFGVVPPEGAGGVGGDTPPTTGPGPEWVTTGVTCYPLAARGVQVDTTNAAAWTDTSWVEIMPGSSAPAVFFAIAGLHVESIQDTCEIEFDIGVGLDGEEQVVATIPMAGNTTMLPGVFWLPIPCGPIAPGTRVAVRCRYDDQFGQQVDNQWVRIIYYASVPSGITTTTRALTCSPAAGNRINSTGSASAWTNPAAWTEIVAATTSNWQLAGVVIDDGDIPFNASGDEVEIDIGVGAASSEVVVQTYRFHLRQQGHVSNFVPESVLTGQIPIGSRVAWRFRNRRGSSLTFGIKIMVYEGSLS